jgi:hypothetical protein
VKEKHPKIARWVGSGIGSELMNVDSKIMSDILNNLTEKRIAAFPLHDSVVVEQKNDEELEKQMMQCYFKHIGWLPVTDLK